MASQTVELDQSSIDRLAEAVTGKDTQGNKPSRGTSFSGGNFSKAGNDLASTMFTADAGFKNLTGAVKKATESIPFVNKFQVTYTIIGTIELR